MSVGFVSDDTMLGDLPLVVVEGGSIESFISHARMNLKVLEELEVDERPFKKALILGRMMKKIIGLMVVMGLDPVGCVNLSNFLDEECI